MTEKVHIKDLDIKEGLKEWIETFSFIHNYKHKPINKGLSDTIISFLYRDDLLIKDSDFGHYLCIESEDTRVSANLWKENKFYSYASRGELRLKYSDGNSEVVFFEDSYASKKLRVRLWAIEKAYKNFVKEETKQSREEENQLSKIREALGGV